MRPSVYLETTIPSYLTAWQSREVKMAARQQATSEWWGERRESFACFVSQLVHEECAEGDPAAATRRLAALQDLPMLATNEEVFAFASGLLASKLVPASEKDDALHIALATAHGMRYLLTWNFKHIANAGMFDDLRAFCLKRGYTCPVICTPEELMETR